MNTGSLILISAPSGAGKTSLVKSVLDADTEIVVCISHTTRAMRDGERDGENYHFVEDAEFDRMIAAGAFLEYADVFGKRYGSSRQEVDRCRADGKDVILEIDWQGADQVREMLADAVSIFILPPSITELEKRLRGRGRTRRTPSKRASPKRKPIWLKPRDMTICWSTTTLSAPRANCCPLFKAPDCAANANSKGLR